MRDRGVLRAAVASRAVMGLPLRRPFVPRAESRYALARAYSSKAPNPAASFYKTFGRPVAKVVLTALLTYQVIYLVWMKLEQDEIKTQKQAEINDLEAEVMATSGPKSV